MSDRNGRIPYRYNSGANWRQFDKVIVDPVTVYHGQDNQFGKVSEQDKNTRVSYMQSQFTQKLRARFSVVDSPVPGTLRIHLTLTGAKATTPVLARSHISISGAVSTTPREKEGSMTGSVAYAVEIYDTTSNTLQSAYVSKQYPNAMNVGTSSGALSLPAGNRHGGRCTAGTVASVKRLQHFAITNDTRQRQPGA
ncbi:DUF3313 domain-containing protein [Agrobacterium sp. OT33]|uniref:DUF3313 domain-containing protein n=1 Tax=Agrobacterium sp. OT33 TaxID=2815338 RepID=UPI001FF078F3|nr:DUF3313 domain-containing protein [Agrobacterium sp. OT33]